MSTYVTPHFHNQPGVAQIRIRARKFMCVGALPPFDHPHIYIDMGDGDDSICPYCSTHYVFDPAVEEGASLPLDCVFTPASPSGSIR